MISLLRRKPAQASRRLSYGPFLGHIPRHAGKRSSALEAFVKRLIVVLFFSFAGSLFAQQGPPEISYRSVPDFLKLPPDLYLGEVAGVAVNSKGHVFVFSRGNTSGPAYAASAAQLLEFGPDGKYVREIGHNLYAW
jgi:hypothetical protein